MKTVSFVIPVYNPPLDLLRGLLDSLLNQSGVAIEIVAVNDGSTNGAIDVLREYEAAHPGVFKIIDRENRGAGPSRNEGFLATTGDYVWFVDADDEIRPNCLGELVAAMESSGAEHLLLNSMVAKPGDNAPFPERGDETIVEIPKSFAFANMARAPWKRILRRDFLARIGVSFCNARTGQEGQPETARWTLETKRLFYANKVWYKWHNIGSSLTHGGAKPDRMASGLQVYDLFQELGVRFPDSREWMDLLAHVAARSKIRDIAEALKHMANTGGDPTAMDKLRAVRDAYKEKLATLPADHPLVWLFDKGGRLGARTVRGKSEEAERNLAAAKAQLAAAKHELAAVRNKLATQSKALEALHHSLSWRITAPLRAVLRPFVGKP